MSRFVLGRPRARYSGGLVQYRCGWNVLAVRARCESSVLTARFEYIRMVKGHVIVLLHRPLDAVDGRVSVASKVYQLDIAASLGQALT